jgi:hypothetical protein
LILLALLAAGMAGCLAGEETVPPGDGGGGGGEAPPNTAQKSSIEGVVLKEDFSFVKDARLHLSKDGELVAETATDAQGRYAFTGLESEEYILQVSAPCCKAAVFRLKPPVGDVYKHNIRLEELPSIVPYVQENEWHGLVACGLRYPGGTLGTNYCDLTDPNADRFHRFTIREGLRTVLFAMDWEPQSTNLLGELRVFMTKGTSAQSPDEGNAFFLLEGAPALEIALGPEDAIAGEGHYFTAIEEEWDVIYSVWAGGEYANVVYQQPFSVYYQLHYLEPAPPGASALP